jgi:hypothetical protein
MQAAISNEMLQNETKRAANRAANHRPNRPANRRPNPPMEITLQWK